MKSQIQDLNGKVALVTGGSRGIGAAITRVLAQHGADVAISYVASARKAEAIAAELQAQRVRAEAFKADQSDPIQVRGLVKAVVERFGRLDVLVNNAGIAEMSPIDDFSLEAFDRMMAVNVRAVFVAAQEASLHMKEGGRIITIGSVNADRIPFVGGSVYAMTKAAVAGFTRGLARDLGPRGITVNVVQPGPIDTDMNPENGPFSATLKGHMAVGRYGRGEEVASMVAYLASSDAAFVTGACLNVDGGFTA